MTRSIRPFGLLACVLFGFVDEARAQPAVVTIPTVAPSADTFASTLGDTCANVARLRAAVPRISIPVRPTGTPDRFDADAYESALRAAESEGTTSAADRLAGVLAAVKPVMDTCAAVDGGQPLDTNGWHTLAAVATQPRLDVAAKAFEALADSGPTNRDKVRQAFSAGRGAPPPPPLPPPPPPPSSARAPADPQSVAASALDAAAQALVRHAIGDVIDKVCTRDVRTLIPRLCAAISELGPLGDLEGFGARLQKAATDDLRSLPAAALIAAPQSDERAAALVIATYAVEIASGRGVEDVTVGLSELSCPVPTRAACSRGPVLALRRVGEIARTARAYGPLAELHALPSDQQNRIAVAVALAAVTSPSSPVASGDAAGLEAWRARAAALMRAFQGLVEQDDASRVAAIFAVAGEDAGAGSTVSQLGALAATVGAANSGDLAGAAERLPSALAPFGATVPSPVDEWLPVLAALSRASSDEAAAEILKSAPGVTLAIASKAAKATQPKQSDPFLDAPARRPDDGTRDKPALAEYLAGLRAAYVFQYWKPADIPDVAYNTTGLNLLRLELLAASDDIPFLEYLQGYLKYEFAPGGSTEQEELIRLSEQELDGWQAIVADLGANLPFLGGEDTFRGPVVGFKRRFFLASAEALKDYWFYDGGGVALLVPGDSVRTNTVMTTFNVGFRSTQMKGDRALYSLEAGGYYVDYRKPYTHSRLTAVDRSALFAATFEGGGAYAEGRLFIDTSDEVLPMSVGVNAKFGPAEIQLDDIAASSLLPDDSGIWMLEAAAFVNVPVFWIGGFFIGGHAEALYRDFGDYFSSGSGDPNEANSQNLNRDVVVGLSAQAGYFF